MAKAKSKTPKKPKVNLGVQQNLIAPNQELKSILEYICGEANKLHNCATYYARQMWFKAHKYVTGFDLGKVLIRNRHFSALSSEAATQICNSVGESISSFAKLRELWLNGELENKPKPPNYRKPGYQLVAYPKRSLKLVDGQIRFPLGLRVNAWFGIKEFFLPMPSNLDFDALREVRILPRNGCFYVEFVYPVVVEKPVLDPAKCLGLDPGLNNWLTGVSNVGTSFIIDGRHLKSVNQWYNKQTAKQTTDKPNGFWSKRLAAATEKRNRQMRDAINKAARLVINHCLDNGIGTLVFGWNKGQKDSIELGKKTNQSFVQIPTARLKARIQQLCELYSIVFEETEESYTSKASFLDSDTLPIYGEKPVGEATLKELGWEPSGKRVKRGLYHTSEGVEINADCNGAANILRKVSVKLGLVLSGISRGELKAPLKFRFWTLQESQRL
ncbi:transposase [Kamptonema sp. UHCC 0994]|uniref:RNA-guided endonuclease InsQ/TnpB family protein n=1 Tax=Kamptonema sp. UHCC 0994 TaxID=3031329 RepID=UPI0023B8B73C|nr:transposase [Kamptonema sp. UHCC 0994]MDF0555025.1 transposase [Kamptonema sp. UHCC 0994]